MSFIVLFGSLLLIGAPCRAYRYVSYITDEVEPCPGTHSLTLTDIYDDTNLEVSYNDDGYMVLNGYVTYKWEGDSSENIRLKVEVRKKMQGQWVQIPIDLARDHLCAHLNDPHEIWYEVFKDINKNNDICPPKKGTKVTFNNKVMKIFMENNVANLEGTYKIFTHLFMKNLDVCVIIPALGLRVA